MAVASLRRLPAIAAFVLLATGCTGGSRAAVASAPSSDEARTALRVSAARGNGPELVALLRRMPKGADLHSHLGGSIYAESYIAWAAAAGLCLTPSTMTATPPPCDDARPPIAAALTDAGLYGRMLDVWSMRNWALSGQSGHDHFFDAGSHFSLAGAGRFGDMLAANASRAAGGRVSYVESMVSPDEGRAAAIGRAIPWTGDLDAARQAVIAGGLDGAVAHALAVIGDGERRKRELLRCGTADADRGCGVTVRYIYQVIRSSPPPVVFAQMMTGFALADRAGSPVVALNLVAPEDGPVAMRDFALHMSMIRYLAPRYPRAHVTLHAGELAPGLVPPEGLRTHIRESVAAGAQRIGHGVDVMHEDDAAALLDEMAARHVAVEICLTSNDLILGVRGADHPLRAYLRRHVPVVIATDDEGLSRTDITREYVRAVVEQGLTYGELKSAARDGLEYAFVPGASLWSDAGHWTRAPACAADVVGAEAPSAACASWLAASDKARLQWTLERDLAAFEHDAAAGR